MNKLKDYILEEKPSTVISVGDVVSQNIVESGISVDILIVDNKTMRKTIQPITAIAQKTLYTKNPAGTITDEAWNTIKLALQDKVKTKIVVDGEEDLLTLVTVLSAPEDALVVYGQPKVGIVLVKVTDKSRKNMRRFVDLMSNSSKS
ncbi:MAG: GTP-dependent dephospho-CoA kinase family protein [Candidatus Bathyarchaeota archaeon]|nr:GTP-dependent dephospho-CoA kinase family protein [Candidatus Bathyarchaeum tardum]WGM88781.1 MAG: GTP-dependent dephospho-CoA kinase family protein [Candidatus Bathyarchaeum tardum]WNZ28966.1 MAG: GTP-dependent dephospho-CoA kinase family protein [Candidatus Bathyarchaeota archaeon]